MFTREYVDFIKVLYHASGMILNRQEDRANSLLQERGMVRLSEFIEQGITAATISRMERKGAVNQLSRGLYQLPDAPLEANHSLAVAAKLVPNGVICQVSALAFHELTDRIPASVWVAIGPRDWRPKITRPRIQIERFGPKVFDRGIKTHEIERVQVRIYSPAKTIVDLFGGVDESQKLYDSATGRIQVAQGMKEAVQGMKEALRLRKATPAEIAQYAIEAGIWEKVVQPRLEALIVDA
jgi:predicted transcriptional regulator of viral defense system